MASNDQFGEVLAFSHLNEYIQQIPISEEECSSLVDQGQLYNKIRIFLVSDTKF